MSQCQTKIDELTREVAAARAETQFEQQQSVALLGNMEALKKQNALLKESASSTDAVLHSFNREGATFANYGSLVMAFLMVALTPPFADSAKSERIAQLEATVAKQAKYIDTLQNDALSAASVATQLRKTTAELEEAKVRGCLPLSCVLNNSSRRIASILSRSG